MKLKADWPHPRNYPDTPTVDRHTYQHLRQMDRRTDGRTDGRTDRCYQVHYLPHFAVDNHIWENIGINQEVHIHSQKRIIEWKRRFLVHGASKYTENPSRYRFTTCLWQVFNRFVGPCFSTNLLQPRFPRNWFVFLRTCQAHNPVHIWVDPMWTFTGSQTNLYRNELGINLCLIWYAARFSV